MHISHRIWGAILLASHAGRFWFSEPGGGVELKQLREESAVAASLLRRTNSALDHCLIHQSFVSEITRVLVLLTIEVVCSCTFLERETVVAKAVPPYC